MLEAKDPAIKLFGKTIPLPEVSESAVAAVAAAAASVVDDSLDQDEDRVCSTSSSPGDEEKEDKKDVLGKKAFDTKQEVRVEKEDDNVAKRGDETTPRKSANSGTNEKPDASSAEKESSASKNSKTDEDQSETGNSQEKTLKKPDKILPCPRCSSMDTKFCYYNNYNVNQPRHFCKNCQRYWTAGGTMRNVPVGAGRRKNKNSASQYRHIAVSEAFQNAQVHVPNGLHHPAMRPNGTVLTFGSDAPLHESMASVLNIADKTMRNCTQNGFHKPEALKIPENAGEHSNGSSAPASVAKDEGVKAGVQDQMMQPCQGFTPQMACFPGAPWQPYPWNTAQWSSPLPPPGFCPPGMAMPFYPAAAYWGCSVPGPWGVPWLPQPSSPKQTTPGSGPNSPLGKHSRDESSSVKENNSREEESGKENSSERCLWIPKTLRIDDPGEAARSSIWATLGIKNDKADQIGSGGLFKAFQSKADEKNRVPETSPVLQANPAALSRSVNFRESS